MARQRQDHKNQGTPRPGPYAAAERLVSFLNADAATLPRRDQELQIALRDVCDFALEMAGTEDERVRFGLYRGERDPMNALWAWYEEHEFVLKALKPKRVGLNLMGWDRAAISPLQAVYRRVSGSPSEKSGREATDAMLSLWLLFLLADPKSYRTGRGFIFHSPSGQRMRLLKCTAGCCRPYFVRWLGRGVSEDARCPSCAPKRRQASRTEEYRMQKVKNRMEWLAARWREKPWTRLGPILLEVGPPDRALLEGSVSPTGELTVWIGGGIPEKEPQILREAARRFAMGLSDQKTGGVSPEPRPPRPRRSR